MLKENRVYELKVETGGNTYTSPLLATTIQGASSPLMPVNAHVTITLPYALEFEISRQNLASAQTGTFRIYGLSPEIRSAVQKEIYDAAQFRAIQLRAGYSNNEGTFTPLIFNGCVLTAFSWREGRDWITEIQAFDGGFSMVNGFTSYSLPSGQSNRELIVNLARSLPGTTGVPIVGSFPSASKRGRVLFGNTWDLLMLLTNGHATIDNGQVKCLQYSEAFIGGTPLISEASGMINAPRRTAQTVEVEMVFEPGLTVLQLVRLETSSQPALNKNWVVLGFEHRGKITLSGSSGECVTSAHLWFTQEDYRIVAGSPVLQ